MDPVHPHPSLSDALFGSARLCLAGIASQEPGRLDPCAGSSPGHGRQAASSVSSWNTRGQTLKVSANREVILSAGAYHSPQLLMLSGIGDPAVLAQPRH